MNGDLPVEHGFPVRMLRLYGYVSACKWLTRIEATTFDAFDAYWIERDWAAEGPIKVASRIDTPAPLREFPAGRRAIAGVAWAHRPGIASVEVRVGEEDWVEAELSRRSTPTWRQWVLPYDFPAQRLDHRPPPALTARCRPRRGPLRSPPAPPAGTPSRWSPRDHPLRPPGRPRLVPAPAGGATGPPPRPARHRRDNAVARTGQGAPSVKNLLLTRGVTHHRRLHLAITLSACGSDDTAESSASAEEPSSSAMETSEPSAEAMSDEPFGAGCSAVPPARAASPG